MDPTVIKVGGSLFRLPSFRSRLGAWLQQRADRLCLLIAGGGDLADEIRRLSSRFDLPDEASHWIAIRAMSVQAAVLAAMVPSAPIATSPAMCHELWASGRRHVVFDPLEIAESRDNLGLPCDWSVTSDSIAAALAARAGATRLVLLKSVGGEEPFSLADAVSRQWVDPHFPNVIGDLDVEWVNLREDRSCPLLNADRSP